MNTLALIIKEIKFRKVNFFLIFLPVFLATIACIMMLTVTQAIEREITRQMRDLGTNLTILHKSVNQYDYFKNGFTNTTLPQEYIDKLVKAKVLTVQHLIGTIVKPVDIDGTTAIVTGTMASAQIMHANKKAPMGTEIDLGKVFCGFAIAQQLKLKKGETVNIKGKDFIVDKIFKSKGNNEDIMFYINLKEAQELFNLPGKVNEIRALQCSVDCYSFYQLEQKIKTIKAELQPLLPDAMFIEQSDIATTRDLTRNTVRKFNLFILPSIFTISIIWIGLVFITNVKERRQEIGILRAMGSTSNKIGNLIFGKAILIGLLGAFFGYFTGNIAASVFGPHIFMLSSTKISYDYTYLVYTLVLAPIICILASYLPAFIASQQDPAEVLREE